MNRFWNFIKDENGLETVEYALVAGLIVVLAVATIATIGGDVSDIFNNLQSKTGEAAGN